MPVELVIEEETEIVIDDDLSKAAPGFSRGLSIGNSPERPGHKYWRRVRYFSPGKGMTWRYYYDNDRDRQQYAADRGVKREVDNTKKRVKYWEDRAGATDDHRTRNDYEQDFPRLREERRKLSEVTTQYLHGLLSWEDIDLKVTDGASSSTHKGVVDFFGGKEPDDLTGLPMSPMRAMELVFQKLPPSIKEDFDGAVSGINWVNGPEDKEFGQNPGLLGYFRPATKEIVMAADRLQKFAIGRGHHFHGGMLMVSSLMHEIGHGIDHLMQERPKKYASMNWMKFYNEIAVQEPGISAYGNKSPGETFAESFSAAILYPQDLAAGAPRTYNWFRDLIGHDFLPPLTMTPKVGFPLPLDADAKRLEKLEIERLKALQKDDKQEAVRLLDLIDNYRKGVLERPADDARLTWWRKSESRMARLIRQTGQTDYTGAVKALPDDRFYEMSHNGRSLFLRIGRASSHDTFSGWTPDSMGSRTNDPAYSTSTPQLKTEEVKEIYDENGQPLTNRSGWYHLMQDDADFVSKVREDFAGFDVTAVQNKEAGAKAVGHLLHKKIHDLTRTNERGPGKLSQFSAEEAALLKPVEINENEFRLRSGTFTFDRWAPAGEDIGSQILSLAENSQKRIDLERAFIKTQPNPEWTLVRQKDIPHDQWKDSNPHRLVRRKLIVDVSNTGKRSLRMNTIRYQNPNPDGTVTEIEAERMEGGPHAGDFYLSNPMWRALLTPNGEPIHRAADLTALSRDAAAARRTAWIAVQARTKSKNGIAHFYHLEVEFDGRGSPKILGDYWRHKLGVDEPRIDHLLATLGKGEAQLLADTIKVSAPRLLKGTQLLQSLSGAVFSPVLLSAHPGELNRKIGRPVMVTLSRKLNAKKAGEVPSPPGWDRMPETVSQSLPGVNGEAKAKLTERETEFQTQGLLPAWYHGTESQRKWFTDVYIPTHKEWERTKDEITAQELPERFVFVGLQGSSFPGKLFVRYGEHEAARDLAPLHGVSRPLALPHDPLLYLDQEINPANGEVLRRRFRLLLPTDGSVQVTQFHGLPGIEVSSDSEIEISIGAMHRIRKLLGGLSMTDDARIEIEKRAAEIRESMAALETTHPIDLLSLDQENVDREFQFRAAKLTEKGIGLKAQIGGAGGVDFKIAGYQMGGVQKVIDNGGRGLLAHTMGTGKTISALVLAKTMMSDYYAEKSGNPKVKRTVIVAPLNTIEQWREAAVNFDEGAAVIGAGKSMDSIDEYLASGASDSLIIVGPEYYTLNSEKIKKLEYDGLIVDEAHMGVRNEQSQRNKVITEIQEKLKLLCFMTGTPMTRSPVDMKEYISLLSGGKVWGSMTEKDWEDEYLEESVVTQRLAGEKSVKTAVKPSKLAELAAIIAKFTDIVMAKDVRGKVLPGIRIEETSFAHMIGMQAIMYAALLNSMSPSDRESLSGNAALASDELANLGKEGQQKVLLAKAIANCPAYKPASDDQYVTYTRVVPTGESSESREKTVWTTFDPNWLMERKDIRSKKIREKMVGRWPTIDEIGLEQAALYDLNFNHLWRELGASSYSELAGTKIGSGIHAIANKVEGKWSRSDKWPRNVANPDAGPVGIRFRGWDEEVAIDPAKVERSTAIQQDYESALLGDGPDSTKILAGKRMLPSTDAIMAWLIAKYGGDEFEIQRMIGLRPTGFYHHSEIERVAPNGKAIRVGEGDQWYSDKRGSLHLLFTKENWDFERGKPRIGGFERLKDGDLVEMPDSILSKYKPKIGAKPKDMAKEEWDVFKAQAEADWAPPQFRYDSSLGEKGEKIAVVSTDDGTIEWVEKKKVGVFAPSLMDPGMRDERFKADVAMTVGNAKAEELALRLERFHEGTGPGPDGERQFVIFGNTILDACRTSEATLRMMGMRDVNEAIAGSKEFDPTDTNTGNGKYFVTYIGATYTGDRNLNADIFKKKKDDRDRDFHQSLFTYKCLEGKGKPRNDKGKGGWRPVQAKPAAMSDKDWSAHLATASSIQMSRWLPEQRDQIWKQFKIKVPEAYTVDPKTGEQKYFYGDSKSAALLSEITKVSGRHYDSQELGDAAHTRVIDLSAKYTKLVADRAVTTPPLTRQQMSIFDNCVGIVCSDAAQVGMNFGNAVEQFMYDSLASPQSEQQRFTRSARLLTLGIKGELVTRKDGSEGPMGKLMRLEKSANIFKPVARDHVQGLVGGFAVSGFAPRDQTFSEALTQVATVATDESAIDQKHQDEWVKIAARANAAKTLGASNARAELNALRNTRKPGTNQPLVKFDTFTAFDDPRAGTYSGEVAIEGPVNAIKKLIETSLTESEQTELAEAGFTRIEGESSTLDPASVYLAIRSSQIITFISSERERVFADMRSRSAGEIVQESDVINTIIDGLSPEDRAVLKAQKYLVNIDRLGVSADMPKKVGVKVVNEDGEVEKKDFFVGHERQSPVQTEVNTRAVARARMTAMEALLKAVQDKTPIRSELDFVTTGHEEIEASSKIVKSNDEDYDLIVYTLAREAEQEAKITEDFLMFVEMDY